MTPKEKAKELVEKFESLSDTGLGNTVEELAENIYLKAKQSALICCDNCIEINEWYADNFPILKRNSLERNEYWQKVKQEVSYL